MNDQTPFAPLYTRGPGNTGGLLPSTTVTASAASAASTQFAGTAGNNTACQIRVVNKTTAYAHVNFGILGSVAAAVVATHPAVAPGSVEIFTVDPEVNAATVILDAAPGTATAVIFTRGIGL